MEKAQGRSDDCAEAAAPLGNWRASWSPIVWARRHGYSRLLLCTGIIAPSIVPFDPWANNYRPGGGLARLDGISWRHLLGTTFYGQDVFSQLVLGTRQTILVGFITAVLIGFIGTNVGLVSVISVASSTTP
jgi:peptide/nickel transport system permease protein